MRSKLEASWVDRRNRGLTLPEILIVVAILAVLAAILLPSLSVARERAKNSGSLNHLRQLGAALNFFAADNDSRLPGRIRTGDKWPRLLMDYLGATPKIYADPVMHTNYLTLNKDPLENTYNHTSYVLNGFNDLGAFDNENLEVRINQIEGQAHTILMTVQDYYPGNFYVDVQLGEQNRMLNLERYSGGANYLFADGSARFLKKADYRHEYWLINKEYQLP